LVIGLIEHVSRHTSSVFPAGAERAAGCVASCLAAPGRFSTTNERLGFAASRG
jgi:hypothetical protein